MKKGWFGIAGRTMACCDKDMRIAVCPAGELAVKRRLVKESPKRKENAYYEYRFDMERYRQCPLRDGCHKEGAKTKTYSIWNLCGEHKRQMEFQKTDGFRREMRKRKWIEAKNLELKNRHGMDTAVSFGLESLENEIASLQAIRQTGNLYHAIFSAVSSKQSPILSVIEIIIKVDDRLSLGIKMIGWIANDFSTIHIRI